MEELLSWSIFFIRYLDKNSRTYELNELIETKIVFAVERIDASRRE